MSEYQTDELRSGASLVLEDAQLQVAYEECIAKRKAEKDGGGLTQETQAEVQAAFDKIRACRAYWRGVREWFEAVAEEENSAAVTVQEVQT